LLTAKILSNILNPEKMNIPEKIDNLISLLEQNDIKSEDELYSELKNTNLAISDISNYINFRHSLTESYGRNVIYESKKLEIVVMSWNVGDYTSIHDHGAAKWGLVYSFGAIQNTLFEIVNNKIKIAKEQVLKSGEIIILDNSHIHQMGNPNFRPTISLHIYYTQKAEKGVTAEARNFDLYNKKVYKANGGAFLLLSKENIVAEEKCPSFDHTLFEKQYEIRRNFMDKCCPVNTSVKSSVLCRIS
jgi:hypothetical protein